MLVHICTCFILVMLDYLSNIIYKSEPKQRLYIHLICYSTRMIHPKRDSTINVLVLAHSGSYILPEQNSPEILLGSYSHSSCTSEAHRNHTCTISGSGCFISICFSIPFMPEHGLACITTHQYN